jgi:hypothetical protein
MIWTAWKCGKHRRTGGGYGFKVRVADRDRYFDRSWKSVTIALPTSGGHVTATANTAKRSFWGPTCHELTSKDIGTWFLEHGLAPWPRGFPPKFAVAPRGERHFEVTDTFPRIRPLM